MGSRALETRPARAAPRARPAESAEELVAEREELLAALAGQQRLAQAGLLVSTISHEVRNSLQIVFGALEVGLDSEDPADWREALEIIRETAGSLAEANDALVGFLMRREAEDRGFFSTEDLLRHTLRLVEPLAFDRGVELRSRAALRRRVRGPFRIALQALLVLTSNAVRAAPPGDGLVLLTVGSPSADTCIIEVADNGPPPLADLREKLKRPYLAPSAAATEREFGLVLVREAVEALEGRVDVRCARSGVCFRLELPVLDPTS